MQYWEPHVCVWNETNKTLQNKSVKLKNFFAWNTVALTITTTETAGFRKHCIIKQEALTVQHVDCDWLFLLDGLRVWEACVADVVVSGVVHEHVGKVQVSV